MTDKLPSSPFSGAQAASISEYVTTKEKVVGRLLALVLGGLVVFGAGPIVLPYIVETLRLINESLSYTMAIGVKAAIVVGLLWTFAQKRTWTLGRHIYSMITQKLSMLFIRINPVQRAEYFANEHLDGKRARMVREASKVTKVRLDIEGLIEETETRMGELVERTTALKNRYYDEGERRWIDETQAGIFRKLSMEHKMRGKSLQRFRVQLEVLKRREAFLEKAIRAYELFISMIRTAVEITSTEYEAAKATAGAIGAFSSAVGGGDDERAFFDLTMNFMKDEIAQYDAQVEVFMSLEPEAIGLYDLEADVAEDDMLAQLDLLNRQSDEAIHRVSHAQAQLMDPAESSALLEAASRADNSGRGPLLAKLERR